MGQSLPALLAEAEHLAATLMLGEHGRRRAGQGDEFWQYRPAHSGDAARAIDWRRSARSDAHFVREREWQAAQSVTLWVDRLRSRWHYSGGQGPRRQIATARGCWRWRWRCCCLRGGERVGLAGAMPPNRGRRQIERLGAGAGCAAPQADYGTPPAAGAASRMAARCSCRIFWAICSRVGGRLTTARLAWGVRGIADAGA
ncbi:MAG: DUF58 domain-containing protein [Cypionkella sp.]